MNWNYRLSGLLVSVVLIAPAIAQTKDVPSKGAAPTPESRPVPEAVERKTAPDKSIQWDQLDPKAAERAAKERRAKSALPQTVPAER